MFSGGSRVIAPTWIEKDEGLKLRPYQAKLTQLTESVCSSIEGKPQASDRCLFEARTAFDCVLRNKVRQYGAEMDNVGACKHQIANMKTALGQSSAAVIDAQVEKLHYARKSFV